MRSIKSVRGALGIFAILGWLAIGTSTAARAGVPDFDGSANALIATPFNPAGSATGGAGLVAAAWIGIAGDIVSLVDDNPVSRYLLHGLASRPIDRTALAVSQMFTGVMESFRTDDRSRFPEPQAVYVAHPEDPQERVTDRARTFVSGLGALIPLTAADALVQPTLMLTRLSGTREPTATIEGWHAHLEELLLGPAAD